MAALEFTKKTGTVKQTVYEGAELQSANIRLMGDLTIDKEGKVASYSGTVFATINGQIGTFRYGKGSMTGSATQPGIVVDFNNPEFAGNYSEASELLTSGIKAFEEPAVEPSSK